MNNFLPFPAFQPRMKCLIHIIHVLPSENLDFLETIIPEIILCTKEVNSKTRGTAFELLVDLGKAMMRWSEEPKEGIIILGSYIISYHTSASGIRKNIALRG